MQTVQKEQKQADFTLKSLENSKKIGIKTIYRSVATIIE